MKDVQIRMIGKTLNVGLEMILISNQYLLIEALVLIRTGRGRG